MKTVKVYLIAGVGALVFGAGSAIAGDKPIVPQKYLDKGIQVGMFCASGVISYCDPGSTEGKGILAEFAKVWGEENGVKVDVVGSSWEALMPSAVSGRTDAIAGIGDYETRHGQFTFIDLFSNSDAYLVANGNPLKISGPMDFCGHKMAAATGSGELMTVRSISEKCTNAGKPAVLEVELGEQPATFLAVQTGRADGTVTDIFAAKELMGSNPGVYAEAYREKSDWYWGVAVPADNKEMIAMVSYGVGQALANGKFDAILKKFGFTDILVPGVLINGKPAQ